MDAFLKKILAVLAVAFLLIYIGYQAYMMLAPTIQTEPVGEGTAYQSVETDCVVVRREKTVNPASTAGYLSYVVQDGNRVSKNGTIAEIYRTEADALAQKEYDRLTQEIDLLKTLQTQSEAQNASLSATNAQIRQLWAELVAHNHSHRVSNLHQHYSDIQYWLNKQQIISGKAVNFTDRIALLTEQKAAVAASYHKEIGALKSPAAGYFVSHVDGYETLLDVDRLGELSIEQVQQALRAAPQPTYDVTPGKIVEDYDWYIACIVPKESAAYLAAGTKTTVRFPLISDQELQVEVTASNKDKSGQAAVVFRCSTVDRALTDIRFEQLQIRIATFSGLRVPDSALRFMQDEQTGEQLSGVYIRKGNTVTFKRIHVLYHSTKENYSICEIIDDDDAYLQLYDSIVTGGKDLYDGKVVR